MRPPTARGPLVRLCPAAALTLSAIPPGSTQETTRESGTQMLEPFDPPLHPLPTSLAPGDAIVFDWEVIDPPGAEIYFSRHIHIGPSVSTLSEEVAASGQGRLMAGDTTPTLRYVSEAERAQPAAGSPWPAAVLLAPALPLAARLMRGPPR